ncbi:hypothetical protein [Streptomyces parvus]|uniref:hypothetical protein n=1 Tax=Streptomyces parvus TaxID=66428 RepID=UPI0035DE43CB
MTSDNKLAANSVHYDLLPVPSPIERRIVTVVKGGQEITGEQRERINRWLRANEINPARVAAHSGITVECNVRGPHEVRHVIGFTEFYVDQDGHKVLNPRNLHDAMTDERWVDQVVPLEADPNWSGWDAYERVVADHKDAGEGK